MTKEIKSTEAFYMQGLSSNLQGAAHFPRISPVVLRTVLELGPGTEKKSGGGVVESVCLRGYYDIPGTNSTWYRSSCKSLVLQQYQNRLLNKCE